MTRFFLIPVAPMLLLYIFLWIHAFICSSWFLITFNAVAKMHVAEIYRWIYQFYQNYILNSLISTFQNSFSELKLPFSLKYLSNLFSNRSMYWITLSKKWNFNYWSIVTHLFSKRRWNSSPLAQWLEWRLFHCVMHLHVAVVWILRDEGDKLLFAVEDKGPIGKILCRPFQNLGRSWGDRMYVSTQFQCLRPHRSINNHLNITKNGISDTSCAILLHFFLSLFIDLKNAN